MTAVRFRPVRGLTPDVPELSGRLLRVAGETRSTMQKLYEAATVGA